MTADQAAALEAFNPERLGFRRHGGGWVKDFPDYGPVVVTSLSWPHSQALSFDRVDGEIVEMDPLSLIANLQSSVWGFPPELVVPTNVMAIIPDTGGAVIAAYQLEQGFNADGWLGFIIGLGSRTGTLVSHMLAVRDRARGACDFGWHLKIVQAHEALRAGHTAMCWTFDPMRGANARLNLEKLGATVKELTLDKYGILRSELYRNAPSDRFTAQWGLLDPRVADRIEQVYDRRYRPQVPADLADVEEVTRGNLADIGLCRPTRIRYRIPGDIDRLMQTDPQRGIDWRNEMREILSCLLTTKWARFDGNMRNEPTAIGYSSRAGDYTVTGFASEPGGAGDPSSLYLLERFEAD